MKEDYQHHRTSVSLLNYHFVWIPKRRRKVLVGALRERLDTLLREKSAALGLSILALEIQSNHVHLFVQATPDFAPSQILFRLKGYTARILRKEFPTLRKMPSLWTRSFFVSTAGKVSSATIRRYIEAQSTK